MLTFYILIIIRSQGNNRDLIKHKLIHIKINQYSPKCLPKNNTHLRKERAHDYKRLGKP